MEITLEKIQEAYGRFKAYVYYDNFNLSLRYQLAEFEKDSSFNQNLKNLSEDLSQYLAGGKLSKRIKKMIDSSGYIVLPKSFNNASSSQKKNSILFSNQHNEAFNVKSNTILFEGEIELHLIATLWIMEEGVRLNSMIGNDSYGYHLTMDSNDINLGSEKLLFTKYFKKYQEWRDKGIRAAKNQINEGNDVLLVSLDIKNFFHSSRINFKQLKKDLKIEDENSLTDILQIIYKHHTLKLNLQLEGVKLPVLPIGLVSSGIIANWLLIDFDKSLKEKMAPVYYGRYVDDIFIVISNVKPDQPDIKGDLSEESIREETLKWLAERFFFNDEPLKISGVGDNLSLEFTNPKYKGLKIQAEKLKLFYFSPDWPHAMLNKFQKTLEENSSAFWFLPDEEDLKDSLDDDAYDMQYEDTINKFRSVADVKASKYGASVFLAKRIKLAILNNDTPNLEISKEIFRFFKGVAILSLYNMWEKVFSYLVVTGDTKSIKKIHKEIILAIEKLDSDVYANELRKTLTKHLDICLQMSFSLNPSLYQIASKNDVNLKKKGEIIQRGIIYLRHSLLSRHHYLPLPSLVFTDYYTDTTESLLADNLFERLFEGDSKFVLNEALINESWRMPTWVYLQEICMYYFLFELKEWTKNPAKVFFFNSNIITDKNGKEKIVYKDSYIMECCLLFKRINGWDISKNITSNKFKSYRDSKSTSPKIYASTIKIGTDDTNATNLKLGLSNMRLDLKDLQAAIVDKSKTSKGKKSRHIKLLNLAEEEKVDLLILPETSVPLNWLYAYSDEARRKQRAFIIGLEHFTIKKCCFNFSIALLPLEIGKMKEIMIVPRLKNHYSPSETDEILKIGKIIPSKVTSFYHLFKWKGVQFTVYNCYELTDVVHRSIFRSELDILFAIEFNRDTNYFSNIAESTCRDLHCFYVQANTSEYGDSRVIEPRETEKMNPVRVKGGENNVILKYELKVNELRKFQKLRLPYQRNDKSFKTTPPDFDHEGVDERGK